MLILIMIIFFIIGFIIEFKTVDDGGEPGFGIAIGLIAEILPALILLCLLSDYPYKVDEKIKMYEEENLVIEKKVKETVRAYMDYEKDTYEKIIKDADLTTLMVKYPELGSNELVKSEVALYVDNNKQIKKLKEKRITRSIYRWWIYFGK